MCRMRGQGISVGDSILAGSLLYQSVRLVCTPLTPHRSRCASLDFSKNARNAILRKAKGGVALYTASTTIGH